MLVERHQRCAAPERRRWSVHRGSCRDDAAEGTVTWRWRPRTTSVERLAAVGKSWLSVRPCVLTTAAHERTVVLLGAMPSSAVRVTPLRSWPPGAARGRGHVTRGGTSERALLLPFEVLDPCSRRRARYGVEAMTLGWWFARCRLVAWSLVSARHRGPQRAYRPA